MAGSVLPLDKFIKNSYGLQVAARCSSDVEDICRKNCLSFCELLRPFSQLLSESHLQDPQGHLYTLRDLRLRFTEPSTESLSRDEVNELLSDSVHWSEKNIMDESFTEPKVLIENVEVPACTHWFNHYCETFLDNISVMEHETVRHFVAVILVVSSRLQKPVESVQKLYKAQKESEQSSSQPYWFPSPHIFYYHVLLHDIHDGSHKHARECFDVLKSTYGTGSCYLLSINSLDPTSPLNSKIPEPWSSCLRIIESTNQTDFGIQKMVMKRESTSSLKKLEKPPSFISQKKQEEEQSVANSNEEDPQNSSSSSVSLISSQVELGTDPLSESEQGDINEENLSFMPNRKIGGCMSLEDQNNVRAFVKEFSSRLLPHLEAVLRKVNDSLQSRRTVSRRVSSISRGIIWKMMGGGGSGTGSGSGNVTTGEESQNLSVDSIEWQMRLVGDLAFLLQNYELAYNMHHTLKRDLQGRDLWMYYAGAHEMAALSAQMMGSSRKEVQSYLEEASNIYCSQLQLPVLGLRASIFLCEILKSRGKYKELVSFLVKQISDDSDLHSALWLEQSAYAYLKLEPVAMVRKYALHLVLSANHFSKAGQKAHALRAYKLALQLYENNGWIVAESFLQYIVAKLSFTLNKPYQTLEYLEKLLSNENRQPLQQQLSSLKDYIHIRKGLSLEQDQNEIDITPIWFTEAEDNKLQSVPRPPLPIILPQSTTVVFDNGVYDMNRNNDMSSLTSVKDILDPCDSYFNDLNLSGVAIGIIPYVPDKWQVSEKVWNNLEMLCSSNDSDENVCAIYMMDGANNAQSPLCPAKEPVKVEVLLRNPLTFPVLLKHVTLTWIFENSSYCASKENDDICVLCEVLDSIELPPNCNQKVALLVVPLKPGMLIIKGIVFSLVVSSQGAISDVSNTNDLANDEFQAKLGIHCRGLRLNRSKEEKAGLVYENDYRLCWKVIGSMPRPVMTIEGLSECHTVGELKLLTIKVFNYGSVPLTNVTFSSSLQHYTLLCPPSSKFTNRKYPDDILSPNFHYLPIPSIRSSNMFQFPFESEVLLPGHTQEYQLYLHLPPDVINSRLSWNMVLHCQPVQLLDQDANKSHRFFRHSEPLNVEEHLHFKASLSPSYLLHVKDSSVLSVNLQLNSGGAVDKVMITQISIVSKNFKFVQESQKCTCLCDPILSGGSTNIHVFLTRHDECPTDHIILCNLSLENKTVQLSHEFPIFDLLLSSMGSRMSSDVSSTDHSKAALMKLLNRSLIVIAFWKAESNGIISNGHQYIVVPFSERQNLIYKPKISLTEPISPYDFVKHSLYSESCISHNFMKNETCTVPVLVVLKNCSDQQVKVEMEMPPSVELSIGTRSLEPSFLWSGPLKRIMTIPPLVEHSVQLYANFCTAGVYNLDALRIKASCAALDDKVVYSQRWQTRTNIVIKHQY